jgi:hypothetical protein
MRVKVEKMTNELRAEALYPKDSLGLGFFVNVTVGRAVYKRAGPRAPCVSVVCEMLVGDATNPAELGSPHSPGPMRQVFLCKVSRVHSLSYIRN